MPTARHLSVSFDLVMAYQIRFFSNLCWFCVLQVLTLCFYTGLQDKLVCDRLLVGKKRENEDVGQTQTTRATYALTSVNDREGYTTYLCKVSSFN